MIVPRRSSSIDRRASIDRHASRGRPLALALTMMAALAAAFSFDERRAAAQGSPIMAAMQDELKRSMAELRIKGEAPPYYIAYEVLDRTVSEMAGRLGSLVENPPRRTRTIRVEVRVGSYEFDSSRFVAQGFGGGRSTGETVLAPLDDDYDAMRRKLWITTDSAYRRAVAIFARKKAAFQNRTVSDPVPDFSEEAPHETILPSPPPPGADERRDLIARVRDVSAVFAEFPHVEMSEVAVTTVLGTRYYLNSEGFRTVTPIQTASLAMYAASQSGDGMPVRQVFTAVERSASELPSASELGRRARELAAAVDKIRGAPIGEDFAGPVLIEGTGSPQFFAETFVQMVQARRPPDTENPRMGRIAPSPFLNRTGLRVMADAFVVNDTPSVQRFEGRSLAGSYSVDEEGMPAKDVTIVDKGRLVTLLTNRTPQKYFMRSNGHGRSGTVLAGVFQVESLQAIPASELKSRYLALLKAQDRSFGYIVRGVRPGGQTSASGPGIDEIVKVTLDGTETPVRGMRFGQVPPVAFRDLSDASKERFVFSYREGPAAAVSVIAPSVIFEELEIQRVRDILQLPSIVPSPLAEP